MDALRYHIEKASSVQQGINRIWAAGLFLNDEGTSAVMDMVHPRQGNGAPVLNVWLAREETTGRDVGMAMVSTPCKDSGDRPVLNLYVDDEHRHQGLGKALLSAAQSHYENQPLAGYYTFEACRLYKHAALFPAEIFHDSLTEPLLQAGKLQEAATVHVDMVIRERQAYEEERVRHQRRRPRPF